MPNESGFFGEFGGSLIPEQLESVMKEIAEK